MGTIPINAPRNACAETRNFRHLKADSGREPRHFSTHAHSARDNMGIRSENQSFLSVLRPPIPQNLRHKSGTLDHCALFCYNAAASVRPEARKTARFSVRCSEALQIRGFAEQPRAIMLPFRKSGIAENKQNCYSVFLRHAYFSFLSHAYFSFLST